MMTLELPFDFSNETNRKLVHEIGLALQRATMPEVKVEEIKDVDQIVPMVEPSNKLLWDERIHSSNKTKLSNGEYKYKRKPKAFETDEDWKKYILQIESELEPSSLQAENLTELDEEIIFIDDFPGIMNFISENNIDTNKVKNHCRELGLVDLIHLTQKPELIPKLHEKLINA